jgi:phage replication initiation protein
MCRRQYAAHPLPDAHESSAPRRVIRGESLHTKSIRGSYKGTNTGSSPNKKIAITDWLNCSFPLSNNPKEINKFFRQFIKIAGNCFSPMNERGRGLHGWRKSYTLGESKALFGIGGQRDKAFLSLPGDACRRIPMDSWQSLIDLLEGQYKAGISRWDGAVDDYEGVHSVDWAVELYKSGRFNAGGNKPSCRQHGNWIEPDGTGRTLEIGKRSNGKLLRIYEKGKQLGDKNDPWVRWEVELHNKDRVIPWDVLINSGSYVAGAYPCLEWITHETSRIKTYKKTTSIGYDVATYFAKQSCGRLINVMIQKEGSPEKVIEKLIRSGKPARLDIPIPPELTEEG